MVRNDRDDLPDLRPPREWRDPRDAVVVGQLFDHHVGIALDLAEARKPVRPVLGQCLGPRVQDELIPRRRHDRGGDDGRRLVRLHRTEGHLLAVAEDVRPGTDLVDAARPRQQPRRRRAGADRLDLEAVCLERLGRGLERADLVERGRAGAPGRVAVAGVGEHAFDVKPGRPAPRAPRRPRPPGRRRPSGGARGRSRRAPAAAGSCPSRQRPAARPPRRSRRRPAGPPSRGARARVPPSAPRPRRDRRRRCRAGRRARRPRPRRACRRSARPHLPRPGAGRCATLLWVLACGRSRMPRSSSVRWRPRTLAYRRSRSTTSSGVSMPVGQDAFRHRSPSGRATTGDRSSPSRSIREHHLVAGLEVAAERLLADLEQAAAADRPAAEQVAGTELDVGRRPFQHLPEREMDAGPGAAARFDAVDGCRHREVEAGRGSRGRRARRASPATARSMSRSPCPWPAPAARSSPRAGGRVPTSR